VRNKSIMGLDLAGKPENSTGRALLEDKTVQTSLIYANNEILEDVSHSKPAIIAIDAPLSFPKKGVIRKADKEMMRKGYRVFPPGFKGMRKLTARAVKLNKLIVEKGYEVIEVHPTSTRKALNMPTKDWKRIQEILKSMGLKGDLKVRTLTSHEIDAVTAALTAYLHMQKQTEALGDREEGYIIVPKKQDWRALRI
jgi:predicted nuclease with RNAse H fold